VSLYSLSDRDRPQTISSRNPGPIRKQPGARGCDFAIGSGVVVAMAAIITARLRPSNAFLPAAIS
jgi:hypothetical protein